MADQTEELILAIERAYFPLPALAARITAVEQSTSMFWAALGIALAPAANATFTGTVDGCNSGIAGIDVDVVDHATSALLGTVTSGSAGAFSGTLSLAGATLSVDFIARGANWTTTTLNAVVAAGTLNVVGSIGLTAASGYVCMPACNEPVNKTLTVVDSLYGTFTATFQGVNTWQTGVVSLAFPGGGGCAAATSYGTYVLSIGSSTSSVLNYNAVSIFNACPAAAAGASTPAAHHLTSLGCPPGFSIALANIASQKVYAGAAAGTYTITWSG